MLEGSKLRKKLVSSRSESPSNQLTLNDWSRGKQLILFLKNLNVSRGGAEENIEIQREKKLTGFQRDQSLSDLL